MSVFITTRELLVETEMKDGGNIVYQTELKTTCITIICGVYLCHWFARQRSKECLSLERKRSIFASRFKKKKNRGWMSFKEKWTSEHIHSLLIASWFSKWWGSKVLYWERSKWVELWVEKKIEKFWNGHLAELPRNQQHFVVYKA